MKNRIVIMVLVLITVNSFGGVRDSLSSSFGGGIIRGVIVEGSFDVLLSQGSKSSVAVEVDDRHRDKILIDKSSDNYLRLSIADGKERFFKNDKRPIIRVVVTSLDYLSLSGLAHITASGLFSSMFGTTINMSGFSNMKSLQLVSPSVVMECTGESVAREIVLNSTDLKLSTGSEAELIVGGNSDKMMLVSSETSQLNTLGLNCPYITVIAFGQSLIRSTVDGVADVTLNQSGRFTYSGKGKIFGDGSLL